MLGFTGNIVLAALFLHVAPATSEMEYFPGLRRPPTGSNWQPQTDEGAYSLLNQLSNIIEEQARRRFQQQLAQQQYYQSQQHQHGPNGQSNIAVEPSFTYQFPENVGRTDETNTFAVNPSDPRYHDTETKNAINVNSYEDDYTESVSKQKLENHLISKPAEDVPYYKLKPPMDVNPKMPVNDFRDDWKALVEKLQRDGQASSMLNGRGTEQEKSEVVKKHMGMDDSFGMYIVALIAGISAAVTVGLIALIIGWYTLHKKAKAAADVEYPAYGVTGPNKDISPSGDRRLAQSAQMYHYQHQKQQIIAMENRNEHHGGLSDVESDDDNEEGDYTVYECPGLAPTGEMEVKNPLFLDDTPVTPSANAAENQNQPQKQQTPKKQAKTGGEQPPIVDSENSKEKPAK